MESQKDPKADDGASIVSESEGYVADDETRSEPTTLQSLKAASGDEDGLGDGEMVDMAQLPHDKQGFLSKIGHKLAGQGAPPPAPIKGAQQLAPEVQASKKGNANNKLGTSHEEDDGTGSEEDIDEIPPTKPEMEDLLILQQLIMQRLGNKLQLSHETCTESQSRSIRRDLLP